jgi:hypothetical protein
MAVRTIGGDTHMSTQVASERIEALLRAVAQKESVLPIVRGPAHAHNTGGGERGAERARKRLADFEARLQAVCRPLRVPYISVKDIADVANVSGDDLHTNREGMQELATVEGLAIAEAWRAHAR